MYICINSYVIKNTKCTVTLGVLFETCFRGLIFASHQCSTQNQEASLEPLCTLNVHADYVKLNKTSRISLRQYNHLRSLLLI